MNNAALQMFLSTLLKVAMSKIDTRAAADAAKIAELSAKCEEQAVQAASYVATIKELKVEISGLLLDVGQTRSALSLKDGALAALAASAAQDKADAAQAKLDEAAAQANAGQAFADELNAMSTALEETVKATPAADAFAEVVIASDVIATPEVVLEATVVISEPAPTPVEVSDAAVEAIVESAAEIAVEPVAIEEETA